MTLGSDSDRAVAIVTGGAFPAGRGIARGLAGWSWPVVVVYLDHQTRAEATVGEIISAEGPRSRCAPTSRTISTSSGCTPSR